MSILQISNLVKTYSNGVKALDDISLTIENGMFGLLGPNGAGKSTLMRILATLQIPDGGKVIFNNLDISSNKNEIRNLLGYLPQQFGLYPKISAEALLSHLAVLKGMSNKKNRKELIKYLLDKVNLYEVRKQKLGGFSGGMKQRFGIAQALITNPQLLIVDEPTAGLDPAERNRFYNILSDLSQGTIVLLSSHIVDDIEEVCTHMAIMNKGKLLAKGSPGSLMNNLKNKVYQKIISRSEVKDYFNNYNVIYSKLYLGKVRIHIISDEDPQAQFLPIEANLEDVYFSHVSQGFI